MQHRFTVIFDNFPVFDIFRDNLKSACVDINIRYPDMPTLIDYTRAES